MNLIEKVVIKDGVNADTTVTINLYTGQVAEINALLAHPSVPNTRGIAVYSIVGAKPTFSFSAVANSEMWVYVDGIAIKCGGITASNPNIPYVWTPVLTATKNLESDTGATGSARQIMVIAEFLGIDTEPTHTIDIKVADITEYDIYSISNLSEYNCNALNIITTGGTFWDGTTTKKLFPNKGADIANYEFKNSIRIMKVGTTIYVV